MSSDLTLLQASALQQSRNYQPKEVSGDSKIQGPRLPVNMSTLDTPLNVASHIVTSKVGHGQLSVRLLSMSVCSEAGCGREDMLIPTLTSEVSTFCCASC